MIFIPRALRVRRLTASFGLSLTAAGIAIATLAAAFSAPSALARPTKRHSSSSSAPSRVHKAMVRVETARLRSAPGEHHAPTALLDAGRAATVVARKGEWAKLRLATGRTGWVRADLLSISKKTVKVASADTSSKKSALTKKKKSAKKPVQLAQRPLKQIATAKTKYKKTAPVRVAMARPSVRKSQPVIKARKPVQVAFSRPLVRGARSRAVTAAPIVLKTSPVASESTAAAVVPTYTETTAENAPIHLAAKAPEIAESTGAVSESVAPVQMAMANTEEKSVSAASAPARQAPPVNRTLSRNERIARSALSYRGVPYRMGATGRGAFDCSGFMMYLFDKAGLQLPRTAAEQYRKGTPVPKDQLKPGDLVFFKNTYKHGVSHVGIYIGGGKFCHASSGGHAVRTDSLSKEYYVNHWAGARRAR